MSESKKEREDEYARRSPRELAGMLVDIEDALEAAQAETAEALGLSLNEYNYRRLSKMLKRAKGRGGH